MAVPQKGIDKRELRKELQAKVTDIAENFTRSPEVIAEYLAFCTHFHEYSHRNMMMIYAQRPNAQFVAAVSKWNAGLPGKDGVPLSEDPIYIKKGERALYVLCPTEQKVYSKDGKEWKSVYQMSASERQELKDKPSEFKTLTNTSFILGPVFDIAQTNCPKELFPKIFGIGHADLNAKQLFDGVTAYIEATGFKVKLEDLGSVGLRGLCNSFTREIKINSMFEDSQRLSTLLHELGHAELHGFIDGKSVSRKELEADMYSLMLENVCGIETTDARKAHLKGHYEEFIKEQAREPKDSRVTPEKVFDAVFARYQKTLPDIKKHIEKIQLQPQQDKAMLPELKASKDTKITKI